MDSGKHLLAVLTVAAALAASGTALAQPRRPVPAHPAGTPAAPAPSDAVLVDARRAYDEGTAQYAAGHYPEALTAFLRAYQLRSNPVVLVPVIECHRQLGHVSDEIDTIVHYLHDAPTAPTRSQLEARLTELRSHPAVLHVTSSPPGATVSVDGRAVDHPAPCDVDVPAGHHTVSVALAGYTTTDRAVDVTPAVRQPLEFTLAAAAPQPAVVPAPVPPVVAVAPAMSPAVTPAPAPVLAPTPTPHHRGVSPAAIGTAIGAGVLLAGATVFGVLAVVDSNSYANTPTRDLYDQGRREALFSDVGWIAGALTAGVAVVLYVAGRSSGEDTSGQSTTQPTTSRLRLLPTGTSLSF